MIEQLPDLYFWILIFIFGAMIGSFLNVIIFRVPIALLTDLPEWGLKLRPDFIQGHYQVYKASPKYTQIDNLQTLQHYPLEGHFLLRWNEEPVSFFNLQTQIENLLQEVDQAPNHSVKTKLTLCPQPIPDPQNSPSYEIELNYQETIPLPPENTWNRLYYVLQIFLSNFWSNLSYLWTDFPHELKTAFIAISSPPSHCFQCHTPVRWYDNLPILSWFILRGKCRHCAIPFSFRYPMIELLTACLFLYGFWISGMNFLQLGFILCFISSLWAIFWIDLDHQFIFNVITYPSIFLGIVYNVTTGTFYPSLVGMVTALLIFESIALLSILILRKEGMGGGDTKLAILLGAWLGPEKLVSALALGFALGALVGVLLLIVRKESKPFPFGPALVSGGLVSLSIGEKLWAWYIGSIM